MFSFAKYYMLLNLYRRAKKNIIAIVMTALAMIFVSYIFGDLIAMAVSGSKYSLLATKWLILLLLFVILVFNMRKIMKILSSPFEKDHEEPMLDAKKEKILSKEHLTSRSDLILDKYRSSK